MGIVQQQGQGGERPGRHHIKGLRGHVFKPRIADLDLQAHAVGSGLQEGALLGRGFMQGDFQLRPHRRQHQTGKAGARTQIGQGQGRFRDQGCQLGAIPQMTVPKVGQGAFGHQIVPGVPVGQQIGIGLQPGQCFT